MVYFFFLSSRFICAFLSIYYFNQTRFSTKSLKQVVTAPLPNARGSVTGPRRWPLWMDAPCQSRCSTLKNSHCSMTISAKHRSKCPALHRQWRRLQLSKKFSKGKIKSTKKKTTNQPNKQTNKQIFPGVVL